MKLLKQQPIKVKLVPRSGAAPEVDLHKWDNRTAPMKELVDRDHDTGLEWVINVKANDGRIEEICRVHAAQPGLACNRAWKLVKAKHRQRMKLYNVAFDCEVQR